MASSVATSDGRAMGLGMWLPLYTFKFIRPLCQPNYAPARTVVKSGCWCNGDFATPIYLERLTKPILSVNPTQKVTACVSVISRKAAVTDDTRHEALFLDYHWVEPY